MTTDLIITRNGYGFGYDWQMRVTKDDLQRTFYLGQDAKVCHRILGMSCDELIAEIGSNDLNKLETRQAICDLIIEALGLDEDQLLQLQPWDIAAE